MTWFGLFNFGRLALSAAADIIRNCPHCRAFGRTNTVRQHGVDATIAVS
jgi:hypothetical protein